MPTIKYFDIANVSHNVTAYPTLVEAEKDLFAWQYVCARLFKVSKTAIPEQFQYMDFLNETTKNIQTNLLDQYQNRKNVEKNLFNITSFTSEDLMNTVKEVQSVPQVFNKDYLLLDLLLTQKLIEEKGIDSLSEYGKNLVNFVENLQSTAFQDVQINIHLVNTIIENEQKALKDKEYDFNSLQRNIKKATEEIKKLESDLPKIEKELELRKKESTQTASDIDIEIEKRNREQIEKNMSLVDTLKLNVYKYLGKNVNHFYNDNLSKLENLLETELTVKGENFNKISMQLNSQAENVKSSLEQKKEQLLELQSMLQANQSANQLTLATNVLDEKYIRNVTRIMKENNNIFLHSINDASFHPDDNSPIIEKVSFKDKVDQIRCFSPSLSCSSFQIDTDSKFKDFTSAMGVIINNGVVASAASSDDGTKPSINGEREYRHTTSKEINRIITNRSKSDLYDEFAINNTEVAGLYCNYDRLLRADNSVDSKNHAVVSLMKKLVAYQKDNPEMPLYILKEGNLCQVTPTAKFKEAIEEFKDINLKSSSQFKNNTAQDFLDKCFIVSAPKNIQEVINSNTNMDLEKQCDLAQSLMTNYKEQYRAPLKQKIKSLKDRVMDLRENYHPQVSTGLKYN